MLKDIRDNGPGARIVWAGDVVGYSRCCHAGFVGAQYAERALSAAARRCLQDLPGRLQPARDVVVCHGDLLDADTYVSNAAAGREA